MKNPSNGRREPSALDLVLCEGLLHFLEGRPEGAVELGAPGTASDPSSSLEREELTDEP